MSHVRRSKQVLEETFQTGAAILTSMAGQRERLKVRWETLSGGLTSSADAFLSALQFRRHVMVTANPSVNMCNKDRSSEHGQHWKGDKISSGADEPSGNYSECDRRKNPKPCCAQSAQRKALDVLNSLGLSDSLLRVIDRRQRMDKWITYGGMLVVCLLIGGLLWWRLR